MDSVNNRAAQRTLSFSCEKTFDPEQVTAPGRAATAAIYINAKLICFFVDPRCPRV